MTTTTMIRRGAVVSLLMLTFSLHIAADGPKYNPALWSGMRYRMIGPERGGRVTAVTGVPAQPYTFYMGSTGGGVGKPPMPDTLGQTFRMDRFQWGRWALLRSRCPIQTLFTQARVRRRSAAMCPLGGACTNLPMLGRAGRLLVCGMLGKLLLCACILRIRIWFTLPQPGIRSSRTRNAAFIAAATAARPGRTFSSFPILAARRI